MSTSPPADADDAEAPRPLAVRSLVDRVHDRSRDAILSGELGEGAIRQDALAAELGVGKIPLREALTRLERDGLVILEPDRGFFVSLPDLAEAEEVFTLRLLLERTLIVAGSRAATAADHHAAERALPVLDGAPLRRIPAGRAACSICRSPGPARGGSPVPCSTGCSPCRRCVRLHLEGTARIRRADDEHRAMRRAWIARDATELERLARDHAAATLADLRAELDGAAERPS